MKKVSKRKKKKSSQGFLKDIHTLLMLVEVILLIGIVAVVIRKVYIRYLFQPTLESPKTEVRQFPADVNRSLVYASPSASIRIPILMYHYVEYVKDTKDKFREAMNINPDIFEDQIRTLKNNGYTFMTANQLGEVLDGKWELPKKPIVLTFDDGHWDLYTDVLPILKKYHVRATAFVIPGFLDGSDFLSKKQLQVIINSGLIEIGAHTVHHVELTSVSLSDVQNEVLDSKKMLESMYHIHVTTFAYPYGAFNLDTAQVVKNDGFILALSTVPGIELNNSNRYFMYRLRPGRRMGQELISWLQGSTFNAFSSALVAQKNK